MPFTMEDFYRLLGGEEAAIGPNEQLLHVGPANHWRGIEAVGGRLWLTTYRLVFQSHKVNVQAGAQSWPLGTIANVVPRSTMWIVPNGIAVQLADGGVEKFVVVDRTRWIAAILEARRSAAATPLPTTE